MKKFLVLALTLALALTMTACGGGDDDAVVNVAALEADMMAAYPFEDDIVRQPMSNIPNITELDVSNCADAVYYQGAGVTGEEFGWFLCNSVADAKDMVSQLEAYNKSLASQYADYKPEWVPVIDAYVVRRVGCYVVYVTAKDIGTATDIVDKYCG